MIKEYKRVLKANKLSGKDIAKRLGLGYSWYRSATMDHSPPPKWIVSFMLGYKLGKKKKD